MIAIDVMGGDHAPKVILEGALAAAKKSIPIRLCGPEAEICQWLSNADSGWQNYPIIITPASDVIAMDEDPVFAVRKKTSSSLVKAVASVAEGNSSAVLSAGNSGALMAASALIIGRKTNVERPAIAGFLPTVKGNILALDLGANTECRPTHLYQFAHLGNEFARDAMGITSPRVALLSNGHEEGKGSTLVKETHQLLKDGSVNFVGNVEPYDIFEHKADIVVTDGYSGNILLKTMEAVCHLACLWGGSQAAQAIGKQLNHKNIGGALLLGVKQPVVVCHGNSDAQTIENAINFAYKSCK